jgi:hypothetical protein
MIKMMGRARVYVYPFFGGEPPVTGDLSCVGHSGIRQVCIHKSVYSPYFTEMNVLMEPGKRDVFSMATIFLR